MPPRRAARKRRAVVPCCPVSPGRPRWRRAGRCRRRGRGASGGRAGHRLGEPRPCRASVRLRRVAASPSLASAGARSGVAVEPVPGASDGVDHLPRHPHARRQREPDRARGGPWRHAGHPPERSAAGRTGRRGRMAGRMAGAHGPLRFPDG